MSNNFNVIKTDSMKVAQSVGSESAEYFKANTQAFENEVKIAAINKHNDLIDEQNDKIDKYEVELREAVEKMKSLTGTNMEIKAVNNNMLVEKFTTNPFQKIEKEGNLLILNGMAPTYKSNETGEFEEEDPFIHVGFVWDAGPECKWVKDGDVIMWTKPSEMIVPFYKHNLVSINETRVLAVINEGLNERFKEKLNGR